MTSTGSSKRAQHLVAGARLLAPLVDGHAGGLARRSGRSGASMRPAGRVDVAPHERPVPAVDRAGRQRRHEARRRPRRAGHEQEARRALVEAVHDARAVGVVADARAARGTRASRPVDERAGALAGARVHDEAGRLVDHEQVVVLVHDGHRRRRARPRAPASAAVGHVDLDLVARAQPRGAGRRPGSPPTSTAPASMRSATSARLRPVTMATMRSTRSPASASGTTSRTITVRRRPRRAATATSSTPMPDPQGGVGHVEDRPPLQVDEVDDAPAEEPVAGPEGAVGEVAERAAEDDAEPERPAAPLGPQAHHARARPPARSRAARWPWCCPTRG